MDIPHNETTTEIFAIWEYDSYEDYVSIENNVRNDTEHVKRIQSWYEEHGGRDNIKREYLLEIKNEKIYSTIDTPLNKS
ncbi:Pyridine nucleotide-disulfide oxidoreductase [Mesobacillus thioparans]